MVTMNDVVAFIEKAITKANEIYVYENSILIEIENIRFNIYEPLYTDKDIICVKILDSKQHPMANCIEIKPSEEDMLRYKMCLLHAKEYSVNKAENIFLSFLNENDEKLKSINDLDCEDE